MHDTHYMHSYHNTIVVFYHVLSYNSFGAVVLMMHGVTSLHVVQGMEI